MLEIRLNAREALALTHLEMIPASQHRVSERFFLGPVVRSAKALSGRHFRTINLSRRPKGPFLYSFSREIASLVSQVRL